MAGIKDLILAKLAPYLEGQGEDKDTGEWGLHCPFHEDITRSASINVYEGVFHCKGCGEGGNVDRAFLARIPDEPFYQVPSQHYYSSKTNGNRPPLTEGMIEGWHRALFDEQGALNEFISRRGINADTLQQYQIGYDRSHSAYTIPVRDGFGEILNVRHYQLDPADTRRKIWSEKGHGEPALYPMEVLAANPPMIMVCEGEWDALLANQMGIPAVTRTGTADTWNEAWAPLFKGKAVIICHDMDAKGQVGNKKVAASLRKHARAIAVVELPYPREAKHGKDLTDYFHTDGHTAEDFQALVMGAPVGKAEPPEVADIKLSVLDTFDAARSGEALSINVTVTGKRNPPYMVPEKVEFTCDMSAGSKCAICPMNTWAGHHEETISPRDPQVLEMLGVPKDTLRTGIRRALAIQKCDRLTMDIVSQRTVEELYVRPSLDEVQEETVGDYTSRKIISVGTHNLEANNTVRFTGTILPSPKTQLNEFQAWEHEWSGTALDNYEVTDESVQRLAVFKPRSGQRPLAKVAEISDELADHVTRIYGRSQMHALLDLAWHSAISFNLGTEHIQRGWLDVLVVGDTRTGKSEAAYRMLRHYRLGEMLTCESVSFAGVVGGLEQIQSKEWIIKWGAIPVNDRRLVVMDEVSGLQPEDIGQMSSIRSSGEAQLTKIQSERALARTRLVWLGNPRDRAMAQFTYGVQAIQPLIGKNEDIARFDLAMSVATDDVATETINCIRDEPGDMLYTSDLCHELLLWAWSRKSDHILWEDGATEMVYGQAGVLAEMYVDNPPLVQGANIRVKLARVAVALALRTYSTEDGINAIVTKACVKDAVAFINLLYGMEGFGYRTVSELRHRDLAQAAEHFEDSMLYIRGNPNLVRFLREYGGHFRKTDIEEMMNVSKEEAGLIINQLWEGHILIRDRAYLRLEPLAMKQIRKEKDA